MSFLIPTHEQARAGLRAMKTVLTAAGELAPIRREALLAIQRHLLRTEFDLDALGPIAPEELAAAIDEPALRTQLIGGMVTLTLTSDVVDEAEQAAIERFAAALAVESTTLTQLRNFQSERLMALRFDVIRRSLAGPAMKQLYEDQGLLGVVKNLGSFAGLWENTALAERYRGLANYPEGTLGREFIAYLRRNQFPFPGQKHAGPEIIVLHDCLHILGAYGTTAPEEIEVASFQAGCQFQDPIYGLLFGLAQYHLDIQMAPVAPSQAMNAAPERMVAAFARGCAVTRDMWVDFDPWAHFATPVDELRAELNVA